MSELHWYYADEGVAAGPQSESKMIELLKGGKLTASTLIWQPALSEWQPLEKLQPEWLKAPEPKPEPKIELKPAQPKTQSPSLAVPAVAAVSVPSPAVASKKTAPVTVVATPDVARADKPKPAVPGAKPPQPSVTPKKEPQALEAEKKGLWGKLFKR